MKKLAFFIALIVGLNATYVIRRSEDEEGHAIIQHDKHPSVSRHYASIIHTLTDRLSIYFYVISKEGIFHRISWERISEMINIKQQKNKVSRIVYNLKQEGDREYTEIGIY
jgi:hypothetical protein